mgnify:FL=1
MSLRVLETVHRGFGRDNVVYCCNDFAYYPDCDFVMPPEILHEITYLVATIGAIWLSVRRLKKDVEDTKKAITNNHGIHIREDLDNKHNDTLFMLQSILRKIESLERTDKVISKKISRLEHVSEDTHSKLWRAINNMKETYVIYKHAKKMKREENE